MNKIPKSDDRNYCVEEYVSINGIEQYFLCFPNSADTIILFLHGGPGQSEAFFAYKTVFPSNHFMYVYYDQRGTGKTQLRNKTPKENISLNILLEDLDATVDYLHAKHPEKKIVILGHSWGSILGLEYIKQHSQKVTAYIGMGQVVNLMKGERIAYEHSLSFLTKRELKKISPDYPYAADKNEFLKQCLRFRKLQNKYRLGGYGHGNAAMLNLCRKSPVFNLGDILSYINAFSVNRNLFDTLMAYDTEAYSEFDIPVYFICGRNDWQVPSVLAEEYYNLIHSPRKEIFWVENAGHLTDIDNPAVYNSILNEICFDLIQCADWQQR